MAINSVGEEVRVDPVAGAGMSRVESGWLSVAQRGTPREAQSNKQVRLATQRRMGNLKSKPALRKAITEGDLSVAALGDGWMAATQEHGEVAVLADAQGFISRTSEDLKIQWTKEELLALQKLGTGDDGKFRIGNLQIRLRRLERKLRTDLIPFGVVNSFENEGVAYVTSVLATHPKESYLSLLPREIIEKVSKFDTSNSIAGTVQPITKLWFAPLPSTYDPRRSLWTDQAVTYVSRDNIKSPSCNIDALSLLTGKRLWRSQPLKPALPDKKAVMCCTSTGTLLCATKKLHVFMPPLQHGLHVQGVDPTHAARVIGLAAIDERVIALTEPSQDAWPKHVYSLELVDGEYVASKVLELQAHASPEQNVATTFLRAARSASFGDVAAVYTGAHLYIVFLATKEVKDVKSDFFDCNIGGVRGFDFVHTGDQIIFSIGNRVLRFHLKDLKKYNGYCGFVLADSIMCSALRRISSKDYQGVAWGTKAAIVQILQPTLPSATLYSETAISSKSVSFELPRSAFTPCAAPEAHLVATTGKPNESMLLLCAADGTMAWFTGDYSAKNKLLKTFKYDHKCSATASCAPVRRTVSKATHSYLEALRMCGSYLIYTCPIGVACFGTSM